MNVNISRLFQDNNSNLFEVDKISVILWKVRLLTKKFNKAVSIDQDQMRCL